VAQTLGEIRIGISGWRYRTWRGVFYPKGLAQRQELEYVGSRFRSVEINGTFYSLQHPQYFGGWADQVPEDFQFAFKGSRLITHNKKLNDIETAAREFLRAGFVGTRSTNGTLPLAVLATLPVRRGANGEILRDASARQRGGRSTCTKTRLPSGRPGYASTCGESEV
jgi:hypothetical protein